MLNFVKLLHVSPPFDVFCAWGSILSGTICPGSPGKKIIILKWTEDKYKLCVPHPEVDYQGPSPTQELSLGRTVSEHLVFGIYSWDSVWLILNDLHGPFLWVHHLHKGLYGLVAVLWVVLESGGPWHSGPWDMACHLSGVKRSLSLCVNWRGTD